ncbi:hypothetical protein M8818_006208 [Zalaria obscura]|uniref:Uncharacterized protein n=1 Tax=Zalaria obscura TaxID=2024903 RepID=A0ACC3S879_9PEZI
MTSTSTPHLATWSVLHAPQSPPRRHRLHEWRLIPYVARHEALNGTFARLAAPSIRFMRRNLSHVRGYAHKQPQPGSMTVSTCSRLSTAILAPTVQAPRSNSADGAREHDPSEEGSDNMTPEMSFADVRSLPLAARPGCIRPASLGLDCPHLELCR